jgi:hypothetical protein
MEFYNAGLLPEGLAEIIAALTPYKYYPDTKVVTFEGRHVGEPCLGYSDYDSRTLSYHIGLYPAECNRFEVALRYCD